MKGQYTLKRYYSKKRSDKCQLAPPLNPRLHSSYDFFSSSCKICFNTNKEFSNINIQQTLCETQKREISGDFIAVNCVNLTCRCAKTKYGISPYCHASNGYADLVLVRKTHIFNYLRYLIRLSRGHCYVRKKLLLFTLVNNLNCECLR